MLTQEQIKDYLPQAYPFLMIDKVTGFDKEKSLTAVKNIAANEWFFDKNESDLQSFPETLLIEAAGQAASLLYYLSKIAVGYDRPYLILGKAKAEFFNQVNIGDQLQIKAVATKMMDKLGIAEVSINVGEQKIADIEIMYSVREK